jgi:hypothetical protein
MDDLNSYVTVFSLYLWKNLNCYGTTYSLVMEEVNCYGTRYCTLSLFMFLQCFCASSLDHKKKFLFIFFTCNEILEVQIAGGDGGGMGHGHLVAGLAIKTHPKKPKKSTQKIPKKQLKNPLKMFFFSFFGFFLILIYYEKKIKLLSLKQIFYQQIRHELSFIYKKNCKVCTQLRIFQKVIKSTLNQELMHTYIRRKRLISKSDYIL